VVWSEAFGHFILANLLYFGREHKAAYDVQWIRIMACEITTLRLDIKTETCILLYYYYSVTYYNYY